MPTDAERLARIKASVEGPRLVEMPPAASDTTPSAPTIEVSTQMRDVVDAAQDALQQAGGVYTRGQRLVRIVRDRSVPEWFRVPDGMPLVAEFGEAALRERISAVANWQKFDGRAKRIVGCIPPQWVASTLRERGEWPFPVLLGISDKPVLRANGTIHDTPGYDPETRVIFASHRQWPAIPSRPSKDDAIAAYKALREPFCDVKFDKPHHEAAAVACILTIVARSAIAGSVPAFMVRSNAPGAGKGLVSDVCCIVGTGTEGAKMPPSSSEEETRKRLLPIATSAAPTVTIDNIEGMFGSASLAAAITSGSIHDRILGKSVDVRVPMRTVFLFTGNNIMLHSDLGRRTIPIEIANEDEHPEDREKFKYPRLKQHVHEQRPQLVAASLMLLRGYISAGAPKHGGPEKGSFEEWDALVRGAIMWAGGPDPRGGEETLRATGDHDLAKIRGLLGAWLQAGLALGATAAELLRRAEVDSDLKAAIDEFAAGGKPMDTTVLGHRLKALHRRPCSISGKLYRIQYAQGARAGVKRWCVVERADWTDDGTEPAPEKKQ